MDAQSDHAFVPCGHICACARCAQVELSRRNRCPVCRQPTTQVMKTRQAGRTDE
jgi:hypothetical protein